jgi:hypothetical protein
MLLCVSDKDRTFPFLLRGDNRQRHADNNHGFKADPVPLTITADANSAGDVCVQKCGIDLYNTMVGYYVPNHWSFHRSQVVSILRWSPGSVPGQFIYCFCGESHNGAGFSLSTSVSLTDHYSVNVQPSSAQAGTVLAFEVPLPRKPIKPIYYYYYYYYYYYCRLHDLYPPNDFRVIKSKTMRCTCHVLRLGEKRNISRILVENLEGNMPLERPRR